MRDTATSLALLLQLVDADNVPRLSAAAVGLTAHGVPQTLVGTGDDPHPLADLACWQYLDDRNGTPFRSWTTAYRNVHHVDLATATVMRETLARLSRRLQAVSRSAGPAESFAAHVIRVAAALDIASVVRRRGAASGRTWADSDWQLGTAEDVPLWLDSLHHDYCTRRRFHDAAA